MPLTRGVGAPHSPDDDELLLIPAVVVVTSSSTVACARAVPRVCPIADRLPTPPEPAPVSQETSQQPNGARDWRRWGGVYGRVVSQHQRENPQQESWIALQQVIARTLQRRVVAEGQPVTNDQEADFLADHIADDLMTLFPLVPREHWVSREHK